MATRNNITVFLATRGGGGAINNTAVTPEACNEYLREEIQYKLSDVVSSSVLERIISAVSQRLQLHIKREYNIDRFDDRIRFEWTIQDSRYNTDYIVPIRCNSCDFTFFVEPTDANSMLGGMCPRCLKPVAMRPMSQQWAYKKGPPVKNERISDEIRRIRFDSRKQD